MISGGFFRGRRRGERPYDFAIMTKDQAIQLVSQALKNFNEIHRSEKPVPVAADTRLFG